MSDDKRTIEEALDELFYEFCDEDEMVGTGWTREDNEGGLRVFKFRVK